MGRTLGVLGERDVAKYDTVSRGGRPMRLRSGVPGTEPEPVAPSVLSCAAGGNAAPAEPAPRTGVLAPLTGVPWFWPAGVGGVDFATPSTASAWNTMKVPSISRFGWNSSQPRSSLGLYPSLWTTAAATAAAEPNCSSSGS